MQQWLSLGWSGLQLDAREKTRKGSCAVVTNMECWTWKWRRQKSTRKPHGTQKLESDIQWVGRAVAFGRSRFPSVSWKSWIPDPQLVPEAWWVTLPHRGLYLHSHVIASDGRCTPFGEFSQSDCHRRICMLLGSGTLKIQTSHWIPSIYLGEI